MGSNQNVDYQQDKRCPRESVYNIAAYTTYSYMHCCTHVHAIHVQYTYVIKCFYCSGRLATIWQ